MSERVGIPANSDIYYDDEGRLRSSTTAATYGGIDRGQGDIGIEERFIKPSAEYPDGSYLRKVGGVVEMATGFYALEYPDKPSPYWHGKAPFVMLDTADWPWDHPPVDAETFILQKMQDAFAGIRRQEPKLLERITTGERRAIEPTSVEKITPNQKFGADMPSARPEEWDEPLRPSPLMRRLGYTAHPDACTHYRKRLMLGSTQWTCTDCGVSL